MKQLEHHRKGGSSIYGGYSAKVDESVVYDIQKGTVISGFTKVTGMRNVADGDSYPLGYKTTDQTYIGTIYDGIYYLDAT